MCPVFKPMMNSTLPPPGELIALDTSFVLEIWGNFNGHLYKPECENFILRTASAGNILCIPAKVYEELSIMTEGKVIPRNKGVFNQSAQAYLTTSQEEVSRIMNALNDLPHFYPEPFGVTDSKALVEITKNQLAHGLRWGDATIYTQLKQENVTHLCSLDHDLCKVNDSKLTIFTTQNNINKLSQTNTNSIQNKP